MEILAILAGAGLGIGLYMLLANSEYYEWSRKTKRFEDVRKKPEYTSIEIDKVTMRPKH